MQTVLINSDLYILVSRPKGSMDNTLSLHENLEFLSVSRLCVKESPHANPDLHAHEIYFDASVFLSDLYIFLLLHYAATSSLLLLCTPNISTSTYSVLLLLLREQWN